MGKKKPKFYVVWQGRKPGVYDSWDEAKVQTDGFAKPLFKSFDSKPAALKAFTEKPNVHIGGTPKPTAKQGKLDGLVGLPIQDSLVVDAAWNTASGDMEYQGIYLGTRQRLFLKGPYADGTNNIGEFLAIVHALALLHQKGSNIPVYSDSQNGHWLGEKEESQHQTRRNAPQRRTLRPARPGRNLASDPPIRQPRAQMGNHRLGREPRGFWTEIDFGSFRERSL